MLLIPLATCLASYYFTDLIPAYSTLPPPGKVNLVVERVYYDDSLGGTIDSCWIERGSGRGLRKHRGIGYKNRDEEGFANGLEFPDRSVVWSGSPNDTNFGLVFRRESISDGNRWILDSLPGYRMPWSLLDHILPDTLTIRHDAQGREIESLTVKKGFRVVRRKEWGPWGPITSFDSSGTRVFLDSFFYGQVGTLASKVSYQWYYDSMGIFRKWPGKDSTAWDNGRMTLRAWFANSQLRNDSLDGYTWYFGDTMEIRKCYGVLDTIHIPQDPPLVLKRGDTTVIQYGNDGYTFEFLDSTIWGARTLYRSTSGPIDSIHSSEVMHTKYTYATLEASTGIARVQESPKLSLRQIGRTLRWTGTVPDGAFIRLHAADGRLLASILCRNGSAQIERSRVHGLALWSADADGVVLQRGTFVAP